MVVKKSDNSSCVVVLKKDYLNKVSEITSEKTKFKEFGAIKENNRITEVEKMICNISTELFC